jgi:hypothetical protein
MASLTSAMWTLVLPLMLSGVSAASIWALHKLASYLSAREQHLRVLAFLALVTNAAADAVAAASAKVTPEFGKVPLAQVIKDAETAAVASLKVQAPSLVTGLGISDTDVAALVSGAVKVAVSKIPGPQVPVALK